MSLTLSQLISRGGKTSDHAEALVGKNQRLSYGELELMVHQTAQGLLSLGANKNDRIGTLLPNNIESVATMFGSAHTGCVFVPISPMLKPSQVLHILNDCDVRILVTSRQRASGLKSILDSCPSLHSIVLIDDPKTFSAPQNVGTWSDFLSSSGNAKRHRVIDTDMASILYTSGSTGLPKGVVLSHKNMVTGAFSVSEYLHNTPNDRLLAVLPFGFDYGFSQLSTAFCRGGCTVLIDYLLPMDVINTIERERITGLAGVPPLWNKLATLPWPESTIDHLRYITNSGAVMPKATLAALRKALPKTAPYLMYGLTEAFRSTYLDPAQIDTRPDSIGKAIPNAEVLVVNDHGKLCAPGEVGELVHRGSLVSLGYWNSPEKTATRFKPVPNPVSGLVLDEYAVWSGDRVRTDEEGYLYYVGRLDEMIKTSSCRVSPTEIEAAILATGIVDEAVAMGTPDNDLGEAIVAIVTRAADKLADTPALVRALKHELANFMVPKYVIWMDNIPRNKNGKLDRGGLGKQLPELLKTLESEVG
ncbi:MAG: acyl-CoA ligase (AMP-forming), exosortase A system-associated [Gammaproteobacteria bacterium]